MGQTFNMRDSTRANVKTITIPEEEYQDYLEYKALTQLLSPSFVSKLTKAARSRIAFNKARVSLEVRESNFKTLIDAEENGVDDIINSMLDEIKGIST